MHIKNNYAYIFTFMLVIIAKSKACDAGTPKKKLIKLYELTQICLFCR